MFHLAVQYKHKDLSWRIMTRIVRLGNVGGISRDAQICVMENGHGSSILTPQLLPAKEMGCEN